MPITAPAWVRLDSVGAFIGPGDAEVGDLHLAVGADQDVGRLDVAVHEPGLVGEVERGGHLAGDLRRLLGGDPAVGAQDVGERAAVDVLHGDEVGAGVLAPVVDADDVRVAEVGRRLRLAPEALDEVGVDGELGEQHLDGDLAVEQAVAPEEHVGHAAAPDALAQLVAIVDDRRSVVGRHCCLLAVVVRPPGRTTPDEATAIAFPGHAGRG